MWHQKENIDIPFNFMIGGDGRVYEARGAKIESDHSSINSDCSISIALIGLLNLYLIYCQFIHLKSIFKGNFTQTTPSAKQLNGAQGILSELKHQKKVVLDYQIFGIRYRNKARHDAEALFSKASSWNNWNDVLPIYS